MDQTLVSMDALFSEACSLGLLSADQAEQFRALQPDSHGIDLLVETGLLTSFQIEQILSGKGRRLLMGPYVLRERLGAGGMGHVYKAEHRLMKRVVALKVLGRARRGRARSAAWLRFRREVQAAGRLHHPNIVTAYDAGEARGRLFLAMEHVEGIDLARLVRESGALSADLACTIVRQTAEALHHAHQRGLIHRDIKPSNIMLAAPGAAVKLLDLGLARFADNSLTVGSREAEEAGDDELCGTPDYMAPEWERERRTDVHTDLYSLGCTFYYLLTAQVPYPGGGWTEKLLRHSLDAPAPLRVLRSDVAAEIAEVVERLMAREREDRYPSAAAVAATLAAIGSSEACSTTAMRDRPPGTARRSGIRRFCMTALAVMLFGVAVSGGARWFQQSAAPSPEPTRDVVGPVLTIEGRSGGYPSLERAIAAARDGDVLILDGPGPFVSPPLSWQGKTLTIRGSGRVRPCVEMKSGENPRQALFQTDRGLTLEGLDLRAARVPPKERELHGAPLIYCGGAPLHVADCRLTGGEGMAVVARKAGEVIVRGCRIEAGAVGLSVEVGQSPACRIQVVDNNITVRGESGAALSLWASEVCQPVRVAVELSSNRILADRIAGLHALPAALTMRASGNRFSFRSALLSYTGYADRAAWRRTVWQGGDNTYDGPASWLWMAGQPVPLEDLAARTPSPNGEPGASATGGHRENSGR